MTVAGDHHSATRAVAFLDILGMRELIRNPVSGNDFVHTFISTVRAIIAKELELTDAEGRKLFLSAWLEEPDITVTAISDSIVVSTPLDLPFFERKMTPVWGAFILLQVVFWLQRSLIQMGVLSRGGLSVGPLYHTTEIVVGEALIAAYETESALAIYPRAILGESFLEVLLNEDIPDVFAIKERVGGMVDQDHDGLYFVDYLGIDPMEVENDWAERLHRVVAELTDRVPATTDLRARQKVSWALNYAKRMAPFSAEDEAALPPYASTGAFELRYPRD